MKKQHSSPRTLRRAAERKARKEAAKALSAAALNPLTQTTDAKTLAATATASISDHNENEPKEPIPPTHDIEQKEKPPLSDARLNANRANAQHSTGPRTTAGRIASSQNRRVHGLTPGCSFVILEGEDSGAYQKLRQNLLDEHKPETQSETTVIEDMAQHIWLRQRGRNFQNEALDENTGKVVDVKLYFLYERYCVSHDQAFHRCFATLSRVRKERELLRLGSERKQLVEMKAEIRERVQRDIQNCRQTGDWTGFGDRMFAFREEIAQKYRPKA